MTSRRRAPAEPSFDLGALGCLEFLWPALPPAMVGEAERKWIEAMAGKLPPIGGLGLELRLGSGERGADLHQQLRADGADAEILKRYLARKDDGPLGEPIVRAFLDEWAGDSPGLPDDLDTLYIEWDRPPSGLPVSAPAIFLPVERAGGSNAEQLRRREAALRHSGRIDPETGAATAAALETIARNLNSGASVNYIGFMLGRSGSLRINVRGIRRSGLRPLLDGIGWKGDLEGAARHFERLVDLSDRVIVGLDFAPGIQPRIGFEAILDLPPSQEPRWSGLLGHFVGERLCTEEKAQALEALPACLFPEAAGQPWPASWLVAAALSPKAFVPWVERRVSHLKLTVDGDGAASAKAYVSAQHHWSRSARPSKERPLSNGRPPEVLLEAAAHEAVRFLVGAIGQDDLWRDFSMPGASDEWVTAFVGWALAGVADERARCAVRRALERLLGRQREDGGWGYNANCASDSDSTAWGLKFLQAAGSAGPASEKARAFLLAHRLPDGGYSTYSAAARLRLDDKDWDGPGEGWRSSHLCVAANAAGALPGQLTDLLRAGQGEDGSWRSYWWRSDAFSTALAVGALRPFEFGADRSRDPVRWARGQAAAANSAFDRAWLAQILIRGSENDLDSARSLLIGLARDQAADGGWAAGAELLLPHPSQVDRDETLVPFLDIRRLFTTASVLAAMTEFRRRAAR